MNKLRHMLKFGFCVVLALLASWANGIEPVKSAPQKPVVIRKIDAAQHAHVQQRIEFYRQKLPEEFRNRKNFAWAVAKVEGVDKCEYFAHSSIDTLDDFSPEAAAEISTISVLAPTPQFKTLCVNRKNRVDGEDCWDRKVDTESKIIEDLAARLGDRVEATGRMRLYTDLYPCASCLNVMKQFLRRYPNIKLEVLFQD